MRRKKYMVDRYKSERSRENVAAILIHNLFEKLKVSWNPFANARETRQFTEFQTVLRRYHDHVAASERRGIRGQKTAIDYLSRLKTCLSVKKRAK